MEALRITEKNQIKVGLYIEVDFTPARLKSLGFSSKRNLDGFVEGRILAIHPINGIIMQFGNMNRMQVPFSIVINK